MGSGAAEVLRLQAAMDGVPILGEEDGMGHGSVVPLLAVPDLVHGRRGEVPRRCGIWLQGW